MAEPTIQHVSDTAIWVAHYRAVESDRPDSLFKDPFAKALVGARGPEIANVMKRTARYTEWQVTVRTALIDQLITSVVSSGFDMIVNLGAGLDTRPYRMMLPPHVRWVEVDYPHVIAHKENVLKDEKPLVQLERISMDLADRAARKDLFGRLGAQSAKILVITEGVIVYLDETSVGDLADDLLAIPSFKYWIAEYLAPYTYAMINTTKRKEELARAPFKFMPPDWFGFFKAHGWKPREIKYIGEVSRELGRRPPVPALFFWFMRLFATKSMTEKFMKMSAYVLFERD